MPCDSLRIRDYRPTRVAAGDFGFLTLIQAFDGPDLQGALSFFETLDHGPIPRLACGY